MEIERVTHRLRDWLRTRTGSPSLDFASPIEERVDGFETRVFFVDLANAPEEISVPLALRLYAEHDPPRRARFEATVQSVVADCGYPAPRPRLVCEDPEPLGAVFLLMDRLPGQGLGVSLRDMRLTAEWMFRLHALPVAEIREALRAAGEPPEEHDFDARLRELGEDIRRAELTGLEAAHAWLQGNRPPPGRQVLCHGDLMMNNLLQQAGRVTGVIDWSASRVTLAERELDVATTAATWLGFRPELPRALSWLTNAALRLLTSRFLRAYRSGTPIDEARLRYFGSWRCLQILVATETLAAGVPGRMRPGNPHNMLTARPVREGYARFLEAGTGVGVRLR